MITDSASSSMAAAAAAATREETRKRSKTESGGRPWSDLLIETVRIILGNLALGDRIRARSVCTNWLLPLNEIPGSSSLSSSSSIPWMMSFEWKYTNDIESNLSKCKLSNPVYKKQIINSNNGDGNGSGDGGSIGIRIRYKKFVDAKVCASKNGWVMFYQRSSQKIVNSDLFTQNTSFFLYNPFTKHTITLPDLITDSYIEPRSFDIATFSSSPNDDDCIFFVVGRDLHNTCFIAIYCRIMEEQKWMIDRFTEDGYDQADYGLNGRKRFDQIKGSVYIDGIFYCVSHYGTLTSFNVVLGEWDYLTHLYPLPNPEGESPHIVELNGELVLVYVGYCKFKRLYVFDKSTSVWVSREERYLKDRALFLGSCGSFAVSVDAYTRNKFANNVYNCIEDKVLQFSFINKNNDWEENLAEIFGNIHWRDKTTKIWIQPPSNF